MLLDKWTGTDGLAFTTGSANDASAVFTMPANALNIAAAYKQIEYTVSYFMDSEDVQSNKQTAHHYNDTVVLGGEEALGESKADHSFAGWAVEKNGEAVYKIGDEFTVTSDVNLYGVWAYLYKIECTAARNGRVEVSRASAASGDSIVLKLSPDAGYVPDSITAVHLADQTPVELTPVADGYLFVMPDGAVRVSVNFVAETGHVPPKTGDSATPVLWAALAMMSMIGMVRMRRRHA